MTRQEWKGLAALVMHAVSNGATAVERVHLATSRLPFEILRRVPVVAGPALIVRRIHDASVSVSYGAVRGLARVAGKSVDVALDLA